VVVIVGLLGPTKSSQQIVHLIQPESTKLFREQAFSNPYYGSRVSEMIEIWLENLQVLPFVNALEIKDGNFTLSEMGKQRFNEVKGLFNDSPLSYPYVQAILSAVTEAELLK